MDDATAPVSGAPSNDQQPPGDGDTPGEAAIASGNPEQRTENDPTTESADHSPVESSDGPDEQVLPNPLEDATPSADERLAQEKRFDQILNTVLIFLIVAVVGVGAWFGITVYQVRLQETMSTPSGRIIVDIEAQVRANPNDVALRVRLGEAYGAAGRYEDALDSLEQALKLDSEHSGAYLDIGMVYIAMGEYGDAEDALQKVIELTQDQEWSDISERLEKAYFYLGQLAVDDGRYEDAIGYLKSALRIRRDASDSYFHLARAYHGLGENDAAIENLRIALTFDPNYADANYLLGQVYMEDGREAFAAVQFRKAADLAPDSDLPIEALTSLGTAEERLALAQSALEDGDTAAAIDHVTVAVAVDPNLVSALVLRASLIEDDPERVEEALQNYERALEIDPENEEAKAGVSRLTTATAE